MSSRITDFSQSAATTDAAWTTVHWVLHPSARDSLLKLQPESTEERVPQRDEILERHFLVDGRTRQPVPVRVVQRLDCSESDGPACVLVVAREATCH